MIRINLLPFRAARRKENIRRQVSIFTLSVLLFLVLMGWRYYSLNAQIGQMERQVAETKNDLQKLEKQLKEIEIIRKTLATIQRKTAVIEDLELNREAAVRLLDAMTQLVVKDQLYLSRLRLTGTQVELEGIAADNQTIADFMVRLEKSGFFSDVILRSTAAQQGPRNLMLQKFSISCAKKPLQRAAPQQSTPNKAGTK